MKIEWSELAKEDVSHTISFLEERFGVLAASQFLDRIDVTLRAISLNPTTFFNIQRERNIFKFVVNKHVTLYYQLRDQTIYLITFWQNSKSEDQLKELL